jgi:hypothetical protein
VVFGWDIVGTGMHQQGAVIIDAEHKYLWTISYTESVDARSEFDQTFEIINNGFIITSVPGVIDLDLIIIVIIVAIIGVAVIGMLVYVRRKK